jgi:K+/H+ antiporter YhaU regulatory subunit KhtT
MEASATIIRHASSCLGLPDEQIRAYLRGFREAMASIEVQGPKSGLALPELREVILRHSPLVGRSLGSSQIRKRFGVTVISITRSSGGKIVNPSPDVTFEQGDMLTIIGLPDEIDTFTSQVQDHTNSIKPN